MSAWSRTKHYPLVPLTTTSQHFDNSTCSARTCESRWLCVLMRRQEIIPWANIKRFIAGLLFHRRSCRWRCLIPGGQHRRCSQRWWRRAWGSWAEVKTCHGESFETIYINLHILRWWNFGTQNIPSLRQPSKFRRFSRTWNCGISCDKWWPCSCQSCSPQLGDLRDEHPQQLHQLLKLFWF